LAIRTPGRKLFVPLLVFACALAYGTAYAQFDFPYDPDFAEEAPAAGRPASAEDAQAPGGVEPGPEPSPLPDTLRDSGPFLLLDRPSRERVLPAAPAAPPPPAADLDRFLIEQRPFEVDQGRWNKMREDLEKGLLPSDAPDLPPEPEPPAAFAGGTEPPKPPEPEVELPTYGTSLSITGRKVIGFTFSEKRYLRAQKKSGRPASTNLIDIEQQLQLRMQGKVGPKITVNVDYDDTKENKQDISVVYTGDPNEVVQNASFGDIDLSLPATEFVSYNKQLFGIRVDLKWKRFKAIFIGSRTKGTTKSKQFRGNTQFVTQDILDINYFRRRYYDISFGDEARLPIQAGSERIYLSRTAGGQQNVDEQSLTVDDLAVNSSTFTGIFRQLSPGRDYTVDYIKGILTFRNTLDPAEVVAVDFVDANGAPVSVQTSTTAGTLGGSGRLKILKTFGDVQISNSAEAGYRRELKTFYSLGRSQVVRDDGRGNFFLRVLDQNRNVITPTATGGLSVEYPDTIEVDFENGIFQLDQPFAVSGDTSTVDPEIYAPAPITKRIFQLEYRFRLKTFFLEPSLVLQSEVVLLDGAKLTRNVDYFIDYESGFLTFFSEERIRDDSIIDITYEVAPFIGNATESLLGTRISYDITRKWSVGSTLLYQTGSKPQTVPTVNELAKSLLVYEVDSQLKDIKVLPFMTVTLQGEMAQSISNPNLNNKALVENMEGIKQADAVGLLDNFWRVAANPATGASPPSALSFSHFDEQVTNISQNAETGDEDTQKVIKLDYDFTVGGSSEASIVYVFSPTGIDFSQKTVLEFTIQQSSKSLNEINFSLGGINEDADGDGLFDTEDEGKDLLSGTLDLGERDRILQPEEDIGYLYDPPVHAPSEARYGAENGLIDSEDLNLNGRLDAADFTGGNFGYAADPANSSDSPQLFDATSKSSRTIMDFSGGEYHTFQVPLNISTANFTNWQAIKQVRVSIRKSPSGSSQGTLNIARIAVVGNTWQRGQAGDPATGAGLQPGEDPRLVVNAVNNVDNAEYNGRATYQSPGDAQGVFNDLYGSVDDLKEQGNTDNIQEQALSLAYQDLTAGTTVFTKRVFARAIDISQHEEFSFLLFGNADETGDPPPCVGSADTTGEKVFFLRAGSDKDHFEVRVPIDFCGWRKLTVKQAREGGQQIPTAWEVDGKPMAADCGEVAFSTSSALTCKRGAPNLQQIGNLFAGVYHSSVTTNKKNSGTVYLNELHLADPIIRKGSAQKLQADFNIPGWMSFGAKYRYIDRNYETPTRLVANRDDLQESAYLNFSRIRFFPMNFNLSYAKADTPNTNATGQRSNTVSLLQQGVVRTYNGTATGNFTLGAWPRLGLGHEWHKVDYALADRVDETKTYRGNLSYGPKWKLPVIPRSIEANYRLSEVSVDYAKLETRNPVEKLYNTEERTDSYGLKLGFEPWKGASLNPSFSATRVTEERLDFFTGVTRPKRYSKSYSQQTGFTSSWPLAKWLRPSVSYNINIIENNLLSPSTVTVHGSTQVFDIGQLKTVNRTANGNISLTLRISEIFSGTRLFRSFSLTNGYQLQDGDVWNQVEKGFDSRLQLWLRTPLRPAEPAALRQNLTLRDNFNSSQRWSPLEAYDLDGRKTAFKTLSLSNNFVRSIQRSETTGTRSKAISTTLPDLIASISQLEKLTFTERWMKNFQMNLKIASRETLNVGISRDTNNTFGTDLRSIIKDKFDTSLSFNLRTSEQEDLRIGKVTQTTDHQDATLQSTFDLRRFRFTPKVDYAQDTTTIGTGAKTQDIRVITPSVLMRADLALPRGLAIPLTGKTLKFTNRIIWTTTASMAMRSSPITISDNSRLFNLNTNADYELSKNLRMTLNGAMSRLWHKHLKEEDFISYQFGTTLTFQF